MKRQMKNTSLSFLRLRLMTNNEGCWRLSEIDVGMSRDMSKWCRDRSRRYESAPHGWLKRCPAQTVSS